MPRSVTIADLVSFAEQYYVTKDGHPWTSKGYEWVIDQFWRPSRGFKWWPNDAGALCDDCAAQAGTVIERWEAGAGVGPEHVGGCRGLRLEPIVVTLLNLNRRDGKSTNEAALDVASIFLEDRQAITYVASAEDQTAMLFAELYKGPIEAHPKLRAKCEIVGNKIFVPKTKSTFEFVATSHSSITGRGRSKVSIDEARDIPARVGMALIPSIFDSHGWRCPFGHVDIPARVDMSKSCPTCKRPLEPWWGRAVIMSSSGIIEDGEKDWFGDTVDLLIETPDPNFHVFRSGVQLNPKVSRTTTGAVERVFSQIASTKAYVEAEVHNTRRRKGDSYLSKRQLDVVMHAWITNQAGSVRACYFFLDCSKTGDVTSLLGACDYYPEPDDPLRAKYARFDRVIVEYVEFWDPKEMPESELPIDEETVLPALDRVIPLFTGLIAFHIDTRGDLGWPSDLVRILKRGRHKTGQESREPVPWAGKVHGFGAGKEERDAGYDALDSWTEAGTIFLPKHKRLREELEAARSYKRVDGTREVREEKRRVRHLDLADNLANLCYLIQLSRTRQRATLADVERGNMSPVQEMLKRIYRSPTKGLDFNSF